MTSTSLTGEELYRALQDHKADDLATIANFLRDEHERLSPRARRLRLLDLCSGVGRTVPLYDPALWAVTCVDVDPSALATLKRANPHVSTIQADLSLPAELPTSDVIICAHNAVNEVGSLDAILDTAARALSPGGSCWLDILPSRGRYNAMWHRENVRTLRVGSREYLLETTVVPAESPDHHRLLLHASRVCDEPSRTQASSLSPMATLKVLHRRTFSSEEVTTTAARLSLDVRRAEPSGRYIIDKPRGR